MDLGMILDSGVLIALITGVFTLFAQSRKSRSEICKKLDVVEKKTDDNAAEIDALKYANCKAQILDFANAIINGKQYSREQFSHILSVITLYEETYAKKHNGELKQSVAFINEEHTNLLRAKTQAARKKTTTQKGA